MSKPHSNPKDMPESLAKSADQSPPATSNPSNTGAADGASASGGADKLAKPPPSSAAGGSVTQQQLKALLQKLSLSGGNVEGLAPQLREHKFWSTQPVPQLNDKDDAHANDGPIKPNVPRDQLRAEPIPLPSGFHWVELDLADEAQMDELYDLLANNYVEDDDAMFRFEYSKAFLKWALQPPGWKTPWNIGVRVASTGRLLAFISAIPMTLRIHHHVRPMVEINFMCVHKRLRSKRLAPVLIKEITRRVNFEGIFQAVYTAGAYLPTPVANCRYYHRSLNPKKLVETGFSFLPPNWTMARLAKSCKLPAQPTIPRLRPMVPSDVPSVRSLINTYMRRTCRFGPVFETDEDVAHWLLPVNNVVWSYVVESVDEPGAITDMVSFYCLPSSVINHDTHKSIRAAYLFYYATDKDPGVSEELAVATPNDDASDNAESCPQAKPETSSNAATPPRPLPEFTAHLTNLMQSTLVYARNDEFDVFNCLAMNYNHVFLDQLRFKPGDGILKYYLYNWRCPAVESDKVGLVML
ncbi:glycylpeptide N-tetradecanoyltransferase [Dimargaris verticillata]|uniref:Glycylpeptide N-tetradecanoyltransferase n=1 Tax=Dimargaris verticillata TaxID=2761393 RepID=A0A9W8B579_9FUNG|nr:glycylpeptide N-tetradecanoyltransferase [Dimargaris verticillata]